MKEAAGEANITVITIVLIALVLAVGTPLIKSILRNMEIQSCCSAAGGRIVKGHLWDNGSRTNTCFDSSGQAILRQDFWDEANNKCKF